MTPSCSRRRIYHLKLPQGNMVQNNLQSVCACGPAGLRTSAKGRSPNCHHPQLQQRYPAQQMQLLLVWIWMLTHRPSSTLSAAAAPAAAAPGAPAAGGGRFMRPLHNWWPAKQALSLFHLGRLLVAGSYGVYCCVPVPQATAERLDVKCT